MTTSLLPAPDARRRDSEPDTLELGSQLRVVWRYRTLVLACAAIGAVLATAISLLMHRTYVAEAALSVSHSKIGEDKLGDTLSTANFRPLLENTALAAQVIKANGLDGAPYDASPTNFFGRLVEVEEVRNSNIIVVRGYLDDPAVVATVVNQIARLGSDAARRVSQQEALQARDDIKVQLDEAKARLDIATNTLEKARQDSQLELVQDDVDSELAQRSGMLQLESDIEAERARLTKSQEELQKRAQVDTVHRTIDSNPAMMEAARGADPKATDLLGLQMKSEEVNPVYQDIDGQIASSRARLAALEREKAQLDSKKLSGAQLAKLNELYAKQSRIGQLQLEHDLAQKVYQDVATSYESARLLVASRSSALQIISSAIPPDRPESRHVGRNVLIGTLSGFVLAALMVLMYAAATGTERRPAPAIRM